MAHSREEVRVKCPACGRANMPGVPFCAGCGASMFTGQTEPPQVIVRKKGGPKKALRNAGLATALILIVSSVSLVFWPFPHVRTPRISSTSESVKIIFTSMNRALDQGLPINQASIREADWNRYVQESHPEESRRLSVFMMDDKMVMVADEEVGPLRIGTRLVMEKPEEADGLKVKQLWVGHLPLPRFMASGWARSLANRFQLNLHPGVWDAVSFQKVENGKVLIGPRAGTTSK